MLNVKFDTGVSSVSVDVSEIKIVIESMLSLYYKFSVSVSGIDSELIPTIENADVVKIKTKHKKACSVNRKKCSLFFIPPPYA